MTLAQKAKITFAMCDDIREVSKAGIRNRYPDYDEEQVNLALVKLTIDAELFAKAYPGIEIQP